MNTNKVFFLTGSCGFIGFHLAKKLLNSGITVIGLDCLSDYYEVKLKEDRNKILLDYKNYYFFRGELEDKDLILKIFKRFNPDIIIHLAAQAGVRYSIDNPKVYFDSNLLGTFNILEVSRASSIKHLLIASTSSVYGANKKMPFNENHKADEQISFYAATKKANEVMSHSYSHIYNIPTTVFRFFTVYGPWGRPDMALFKFTKSILEDRSIQIFNNGKMKRDFTYIDDLTQAIYLLIDKIPNNVKEKKQYKNDTKSSSAPWRLVNIGNSKPTNLMDYIVALEIELGKKAKKEFLGMQKGDVKETYSDISLLKAITNFSPNIEIKDGIRNFVKWYRDYYKVLEE